MVCLDVSVTLSLIVFGDGNNDVAVSAHDLDKDELKWDDHEGVMSDVVIL